MEAKEFDEMKFHDRMKLLYKGNKHDLMSVDFEERLLAYNIETDEDLRWVRCENAQVIDLLKTPK